MSDEGNAPLGLRALTEDDWLRIRKEREESIEGLTPEEVELLDNIGLELAFTKVRS